MTSSNRFFSRNATFSALLLVIFFASSAFDLSRTVKGRVTAEFDENILSGVEVRIKGTEIKTATDAQGNFTIAVSGRQAVLVFNHADYKTKEITIGNQPTVHVSLADNLESLPEVMVIGFTRPQK